MAQFISKVFAGALFLCVALLSYSICAAPSDMSTAQVRINRSLSDAVRYDKGDGLLYLTFSRDQNVAIDAYMLNGQSPVNLSTKRFFKTGNYSFLLSKKKLGKGVLVVAVKGETFSKSIKIPLQ